MSQSQSGGGGVLREEHPLAVALTLVPVAVVRALSAAVPGHYDADCFWVAAAGREMLRTHTVPATNTFSFVDGSEPWVMHEWLMGPPFAWGLAHLGPSFLALVAVVAAALTLTIALLSIVRDSRSALGAWACAALLLGAFSDRFVTARPTGLSLFFPTALLSLALRPAWGKWEAGLSAVLMLGWTNAHGSFPLGLAILGLAALSPGGRFWRLGGLAASALATLGSPYGLRLHAFVAHYLLGDKPVFALVHQRIEEFSPLWRAPAFSGWQVLLGLCGLGGLIVCGLRVRGSRGRTLACLPLLLLGVRNARHLELAGVLSVMLLAPAASSLAESMGADRRAPRWLGWVAAAAGLVGLLGWTVRAARSPRDDALLGWHRGAALLSDELPAGAHVLAPFDTASLVTWRAFSRGVLTVADSRNDCFRRETLETFFDVETGSPSVDLGGYLSRVGATHVLVPDRHALAAPMRRLSGWPAVGAREGWTLYAHPSQD